MFTTTPRKLAAGAVITAFLSAAFTSHAQTPAPAPTPASATTTTRPGQMVQGRRMLWDRTRVAVDRAQREAILANVRRAEQQKAHGLTDPLPTAAQQDPRQPYNPEPAAEAVRLVKAAYLGVASSPASAVLRRQLTLADGVGLVIEFVEPGSPADVSGVQPYDVLVRLNEQILVNPQQLAVLVRTFEPGDEVRLALIRERQPVDVPVKLAEREMKPLAAADAPGMGMEDLPLGLADVRARVLGDGPRSPGPASADELKPGLVYADPTRVIQLNDFVLVKLKDVEGPGVATLKRQIIGQQGTLQLPQLEKPVRAVGCTPAQLESSVRSLYRSLGVEGGGTVDVFVCAPDDGAWVLPPQPAVKR